jgi:hypothetical protein
VPAGKGWICDSTGDVETGRLVERSSLCDEIEMHEKTKLELAKIRHLIEAEIQWLDHMRATGRMVTMGNVQESLRKLL